MIQTLQSGDEPGAADPSGEPQPASQTRHLPDTQQNLTAELASHREEKVWRRFWQHREEAEVRGVSGASGLLLQHPPPQHPGHEHAQVSGPRSHVTQPAPDPEPPDNLLPSFRLNKFLQYLSEAGFRVSRTHFDPTGVRTDATLEQFKSVLTKYSVPTCTSSSATCTSRQSVL